MNKQVREATLTIKVLVITDNDFKHSKDLVIRNYGLDDFRAPDAIKISAPWTAEQLLKSVYSQDYEAVDLSSGNSCPVNEILDVAAVRKRALVKLKKLLPKEELEALNISED